MHIPIDIRLYIFQYGASRKGLCIHDYHLVDEIKKYEPAFDQKEWSSRVSSKKKILLRLRNKYLKALYNHIRKSSIKLSFSKKYDSIYVENTSSQLYPWQYGRVLGLLRKIYPRKKFNEYKHSINISDGFEIYRDLMFLSIYRESPNRGSIHTSDAQIGLEILDATPLSLDQYLMRIFRGIYIKRYREYPLYLTLKNTKYTISTCTIDRQDVYVFTLEDKDNMGTTMIQADKPNRYIFWREDPTLCNLLQIDKFYHPYAPIPVDALSLSSK